MGGNQEEGYMDVDNNNLPEFLPPIQQQPNNGQGASFNLNFNINMAITDRGASTGADLGWFFTELVLVWFKQWKCGCIFCNLFCLV